MADFTEDSTKWVCGISKNKIQQGYLLAGFMAASGFALMFYLDDASEDATFIGMVNLFFACAVFFMTRRSITKSSRLLVYNTDGVWFQDLKGPAIP